MQSTTTHVLAGDSWVCRGGVKIRIAEQQHYRLVLGTVGYGLKHVRGAEELLHATHDVYTGTSLLQCIVIDIGRSV